MDVKIFGTIVLALPIQQGVSQRTGNSWMRASYIIEHEHGQYPKRMVFDVNGAKIQELNLQVGEEVTLHVNISCREYPENSGKFFNSIEAWKADRAGQQMTQGQQVQNPYPPQGQQYAQNPYPQGQVQNPYPPQGGQYQGAAPFPQQGQQPMPGQQNIPFPGQQ